MDLDRMPVSTAAAPFFSFLLPPAFTELRQLIRQRMELGQRLPGSEGPKATSGTKSTGKDDFRLKTTKPRCRSGDSYGRNEIDWRANCVGCGHSVRRSNPMNKKANSYGTA